MNILRTGDTLVVWRLDRLGRSLKELVELIENLKLKGISLKSISDGVEANAENKSSASDLVFKIFAVLAEFERNLIQERTKAGLKAARQRGRLGGRPPGPKSKQKVRLYKATIKR